MLVKLELISILVYQAISMQLHSRCRCGGREVHSRFPLERDRHSQRRAMHGGLEQGVLHVELSGFEILRYISHLLGGFL